MFSLCRFIDSNDLDIETFPRTFLSWLRDHLTCSWSLCCLSRTSQRVVYTKHVIIGYGITIKMDTTLVLDILAHSRYWLHSFSKGCWYIVLTEITACWRALSYDGNFSCLSVMISCHTRLGSLSALVKSDLELWAELPISTANSILFRWYLMSPRATFVLGPDKNGIQCS